MTGVRESKSVVREREERSGENGKERMTRSTLNREISGKAREGPRRAKNSQGKTKDLHK